MREKTSKRVFFGWEAVAPWPEQWPSGRVLEEKHRHMTLAFLGEIPFETLRELLPQFPKPSFKLGPVGLFDKPVFLPKRHPHVVAWHVAWINQIDGYQKECADWLRENGFDPHTKDPFLPHVTICRSPFDENEWKKSFTPLPMFLQDVKLYESLGYSQYNTLWSIPLKPPFEEIEHTADIAFKIYGESLEQIQTHAEMALCFKFPLLLPFLEKSQAKSVEELVGYLNTAVTRADSARGCPFKAVSYHGDIKKNELWEWEMIIDV